MRTPDTPRYCPVDLDRLVLGEHTLDEIHLGGYAYGPPLGEAPVYLVVGGITALPFPFGGLGHGHGWWPSLAGPGLIDPVRNTVLCPAWPANGSLWRGLDPQARQAPPGLSTAELSDLVAAWLDGLGCTRPVRFVGASLGALVGLHLAVRHPHRVERLVGVSAGLRPDGWGTAVRHLQRELVRDGLRTGDLHAGLTRARQLGMLTYRGREELDTRFEPLLPGADRPGVASYLDHHGKRFADAFPAATFLMLSEAIDRCAVAATPEARRPLLAGLRCPVVTVGVPGDLLFPFERQAELHDELTAAGVTSSLHRLESPFGHDAFLADQARLADLLRAGDLLGAGIEQPSPETRALHAAIDAHGARAGQPFLHPEEPSVMLDLVDHAQVIAWQEQKGECLFAGQRCWAELPPLYARYGTRSTAALIATLRELEQCRAALAVDSGMQAIALTFDVLMQPGSHAVLMRQVYNKTRSYLELLARRLGGEITVVDDGDWAALTAAVRRETALIFAETFTNPRLRAQDPVRLGAFALDARRSGRAPDLRLVLDTTIASPWSLRQPALSHPGVDVVVASGTKSTGGQDRDLWGYIATQDIDLANQVMDLMAMRGGIIEYRRAAAIDEALRARAPADFARRCAGATAVAHMLAAHPAVSEVFHPSRPDHPDRAVIDAHYARHGSLLSFRVAGADEDATRAVADRIAATRVFRCALSFDGLVSKVNHHKSVSEYFTPDEVVARNGFDRLIRLGIGLETPADLVAALRAALPARPL